MDEIVECNQCKSFNHQSDLMQCTKGIMEVTSVGGPTVTVEMECAHYEPVSDAKMDKRSRAYKDSLK